MGAYYGTYQRLNVTAADSPRTVIRRALGKLKKRGRYARKFRTQRHAFLREMLAYHEQWRETCRRYRM